MTRKPDNLTRAGNAAATMPPLLLAAEQVAHGFMQGAHGRRRAGVGETFWQYRPFQAGDTARDIDWRQSAKRDGYFVRQNEWEAAQAVYLWRDASASMRAHGKRDYADVLLLALGMVLLAGNERIGLTGGQAQSGHDAIYRVYDGLPAQGGWGDGVHTIPRGAQVVLIGDFFMPPDDVAAVCTQLAAQGVKGLLVQLTAPDERDLAYRGHVRFCDPEGVLPDMQVPQAAALRDEYRARFLAHRQALVDITARLGWQYVAAGTEDTLETVLSHIHTALSGKG